ncbi:MAG: hypothetical protein U0795_15670 [Pirellulales bacterium]
MLNLTKTTVPSAASPSDHRMPGPAQTADSPALVSPTTRARAAIRRPIRTLLAAAFCLAIIHPSTPAHAEPPTPADRQRWEEAGLRVLSSPHLTLVTDLPSSPAVDQLPQVFEQACPQWEAYFGLTPGQLDPWHVTGSLIVDRERFRRAGLFPDTLPEFPFGYQLDDRLWMFDQPSDYYRRHLLLHEGTHAIVRHLTNTQGPPWYIEGLAELLATHRLDDRHQLTLNVIPANRQAVPMWGRLKIVREAAAAKQVPSFADVAAYDSTAHRQLSAYAWSWVAQLLLDHHPRYNGAGRDMLDRLNDRPAEFYQELLHRLGPAAKHLEADWQILTSELDFGYDVARGAITTYPDDPSAPNSKTPAGGPVTREPASETMSVAAERSWQLTPWRVEPGRPLHLTAEGRVVLGTDPRPWESEPQGVTVEYYRGRPLGELSAMVYWDEPAEDGRRWSDWVPVGRDSQLEFNRPGWLYLRANEAPGALGDNSGAYTVRVRPD